jgi:hypothetical protein
VSSEKEDGPPASFEILVLAVGEVPVRVPPVLIKLTPPTILIDRLAFTVHISPLITPVGGVRWLS